MNKVHREGVAIRIAFASAAKRAILQDPKDGERGTNYQHLPDQRSTGLVAKLKGLLRRPTRFIYRLLNAVFHPVAFRLRRYLTESLREDILTESARTRQEVQRMCANVLQEVRAHELKLSDDLSDRLWGRLDRIEQYSCAGARRVAISCGQAEVLVRTEVGYILCSASDHAVLASLIETGELERGTRLLIQRFLGPDDVFIDVGANLGLHAVAAARTMQSRGKIIAFEPFGPTKQLLEKSIWINGFSKMIEIHQAAVSNQTGHKTLFLGASSGHHSLFALDTPGGFSSQSIDVPTVRLDDVVHAGEYVSLVKIDVEGAELEVLESARLIIQGNPDIALIVEFGPSHLKRSGHSTAQWLTAFTNMGLVYRIINPFTGRLDNCSNDQLENAHSSNLFFARPDSKSWARAEGDE